MNSEVFAAYVPAINAYINAKKDASLKAWTSVSSTFFRMNVDETFSSKAALADAFAEVKYPNYPRIKASNVGEYFDDFTISEKTLARGGFIEDVDYIIDTHGLRITFETFRNLVFTKGDRDLIEAYGFVDKVYQMHCRYATAMMNRSRNPTHWTIIERVGSFTRAMQPHVDVAAAKPKADGKEPKAKFLIMDDQPKVYCIYKGTRKTLEARIQKNNAEHEAYNALSPSQKKTAEKKAAAAKTASKKAVAGEPKGIVIPKHAPDSIIPIYETVLSNIDDEINAIACFIEENVSRPYRKSQLEEDMITSIALTKHHVKATKSLVLIDPTQEEFQSSDLVACVNTVRTMLQLGQKTHEKVVAARKLTKEKGGSKKKTDSTPFVDIGIFESSEGSHIDGDQRIELHANDYDNTTLINTEAYEDDTDEESISRRLSFTNPTEGFGDEEEEFGDEEEAEDMDLDSDEEELEEEEPPSTPKATRSKGHSAPNTSESTRRATKQSRK